MKKIIYIIIILTVLWIYRFVLNYNTATTHEKVIDGLIIIFTLLATISPQFIKEIRLKNKITSKHNLTIEDFNKLQKELPIKFILDNNSSYFEKQQIKIWVSSKFSPETKKAMIQNLSKLTKRNIKHLLLIKEYEGITTWTKDKKQQTKKSIDEYPGRIYSLYEKTKKFHAKTMQEQNNDWMQINRLNLVADNNPYTTLLIPPDGDHIDFGKELNKDNKLLYKLYEINNILWKHQEYNDYTELGYEPYLTPDGKTITELFSLEQNTKN